MASPFRWGLIGYGDLPEKRVAAALQTAPGSALAGLWGRDFAKATAFAARHGIGQVHATFESLLESGIDAVYVCTPPDAHAAYAVPALERGIPALVEKPMAAESGDCAAMIEAARRSGATLGVAYYRRAFPKMIRIRELIREGMLGTVTWVNIVAHSWYPPPADGSRPWRLSKTRGGGGGAVADIGVHRLDLLDYWLGPARLEWHLSQNLVHDYEVDDGCSALLRLAAGAPVHAYFSWNSKTSADRFEIVGSEGKLVADPLDGPGLSVWRANRREDFEIAPPGNLQLPCVADFADAVRQHRRPLCDGESALRTNRLLEEIVKGGD